MGCNVCIGHFWFKHVACMKKSTGLSVNSRTFEYGGKHVATTFAYPVLHMGQPRSMRIAANSTCRSAFRTARSACLMACCFSISTAIRSTSTRGNPVRLHTSSTGRRCSSNNHASSL